MGAVKEDPGEETSGVSVAEPTTALSVVGKAPGKAAPFAFTPGPAGADDATTDESSVGIRAGAAAALDGAGVEAGAAAVGFWGKAGLPVMLAFSSAAC